MHRIANINRIAVSAARTANRAPGFGAPATRLGAVRCKTDETSVGNDPDDALKKSHDDAIRSASDGRDSESLTEGHSLDKSKADPKRRQDAHTEELTKGMDQAKGKGGSTSSSDAINMSQGEGTGGNAQKAREKWGTSAAGYQPGQEGEQVGGKGGPEEGQQPGEGMAGTEDAPKNTTFSAAGQALKNVFGRGPASGFHTYARLRYPSSVPEEAVDKGARKPKDTGTGAEQTPHLPHHNAGEGDKMPAVQNNASLPSKKGNIDGDKKKPVKASSKDDKETNTGKGPAGDARPTGTADTPGSRAVDLKSKRHGPSFSPVVGPSATYTHVVGNPDPNSYQTNYQYATQTDTGAVPSGSHPRSSTSTSTYHADLTKDLPKNAAGIGSSNKMINDPLKGADEMVAQMDHGSAEGVTGNKATKGESTGDIGGRNQPPDVGEIPEDTLPKPVNP